MARGESSVLVWLLTGAVLLSVAAQSGAAVKAPPQRAEDVCARQRDDAIAVMSDANRDAETRSLARRIENAFALFRFHRAEAAQGQLDRVVGRIESRPDLFRSRAGPIARALEAMRNCVSGAQAPDLATVNVRVFRLDGGSLDALGARGGAGVYVRVEGIPVGRTAAGGTLRVQMPSGHVVVTAVVPSSAEGVKPVTMEPGSSGSVSVGLEGDGDVIEETDLAVREAVSGVVHATAPSLTLQFSNDNGLVPIVEQAEVELIDSSYGVQQNLSRLFTIRAGAIVARDVRTVFAAVRPLPHERVTTVRLLVHGVDADGFTHGNDVEFRVQ
jgi:hypothetical protein